MDVREATGLQRASGIAIPAFQLSASSRATAPAPHRAAAGERQPSAYVRFGFKRALDIVVSLVGIALILPLLPLIALALLIQDGAPLIYRQVRVGLGGEPFSILKFRSMSHDANERLRDLLQNCSESRREWDTAQKLRNDPRIHFVGGILRRSSLDELPQFFNVLRGDMSIVGPRPMMVDQIAIYGTSFGSYTSVRPGITGLWQVSGRNTLSFDQRVELDARYSQDVTFLGDMRILVRTVWVVLIGHGSC